MMIAMMILSLINVGFGFQQEDKYLSARNRMVTVQITDRGISNGPIIKAMRKVPRHLFVPEKYRDDAYGDFPLPIGYGQTISQPYIVAYMTAAVKPSAKKKVLEIGTGSGYQAAILAEIADTVYTIEIIPELAAESATRFKKLGYSNIFGRAGDGYLGWPEHAPFDIIIVTAAVQEIPKPLTDQLSEGGRMIIPVGDQGAVQQLMMLVKKNNRIEKTNLIPVRFVPFIRSETSP
jgi:protein-L-isoaspartate(D-aspartate) O-methyltransferase